MPRRTSPTPCLLAGALVLAACNPPLVEPRGCSPGSLECIPVSAELPFGGVRVCNERGTGWLAGQCDPDQVCVPGECDDPELCPDVCKDVVCAPGAEFCGGNSIYVYECDSTGTTGCFVESCASDPYEGVCFAGTCVATCGAGQKSYLGCEYFAVDLDNAFVDCDGSPGGQFCDASVQQFALVVSNPDSNIIAHVIITEGKLPVVERSAECQRPGSPPPPDNFISAAVIPPKGIKVFNLPADRGANGTQLASLAYRVASNIPVTAFQFNPLENVEVFSNDASMLMPTTSADRRFYAMALPQLSTSLRAFVTVVGIDDEPTTVTVAPTASIGAGLGVDYIPLGSPPRQFILDKFDVLNLEPDQVGADLTGTLIVADRPVIAFSGNEAANAPVPHCDVNGLCNGVAGETCDTDAQCWGRVPCCADHVEQQLFPVTTWGRDYLAVRSYPRGEELDIWRILAAEDDTTVALDPAVASVPTLDAGQWFEFETGLDFEVHADKPVLVAQFLAGQGSRGAGIGDPAMILAVPVRQLRSSYVFLAPGISSEGSIGYARDYVAIAVPRDVEAFLDGSELRDLQQELPGLVRSAPIGAGAWTAFRIPIDDGFHKLDCLEPCSVMVHGYDRAVSYGYPGGLNLLECLEDADCRGAEGRCNRVSGDAGEFTCVECLVDGDCAPLGDGLVCGDDFDCALP